MENWTEKIKRILKEIRSQRRWRVILTTMAGAVVFVTTYALILPGITLEEEVALEDPGIFLEGDFAEDVEAGLPVDGEEGFFLEDDALIAEDQELDGFADSSAAGDLATLEGYQEYEGAVDAEGLGLDAGLADGIVTDGFLIEDVEAPELEDELSTDHFRIRMDEDAMVPEGTTIAVKEVKDVQLYQETAAMLLGTDIDAMQVYEIRLKKDEQEILPMAEVTVESTVEAAKNADVVLAFSDPTYAKQVEVLEQSDRLVFETDEITYIAFCSVSDALEAQELAQVQDLPDAMEVEAAWDEEAPVVVDDAFVDDGFEKVAEVGVPEFTEEVTPVEEPAAEEDIIADEPAIEENIIADEPIIEEVIAAEEPEVTEVIADEPAMEEEITADMPVAEEAVIDDGQIVEETAATEAPIEEAPVVEEPAVEAPLVEAPVVEEPLEEVLPIETEAPADEEAPIMEGISIVLARENAEETDASEAEENELTTEQEVPAETAETPLPVGIAMELYLGDSEGTIGAVEIETEEPAETEMALPATEEETEAQILEIVLQKETEDLLIEEETEETALEEAPQERMTEAATEEPLFEEETEASLFEEETEVETETESVKTLTAKADTYEIVVNYDDNAGIPEGAQLEVTEILQGESQPAENETENQTEPETNATGTNYEACLEKSREYIDEGSTITYARFFSIRIMYDGQEVIPETPVTVNIYLADVKEDVELNTVHLTEDSAEIIGTNTQEGISFETSGF